MCGGEVTSEKVTQTSILDQVVKSPFLGENVMLKSGCGENGTCSGILSCRGYLSDGD